MAPTTLLSTPAEPALSLEDVNRLRLVIARLHRRMRQQANAGITPSQLAVLGTLSRLGPLTLGELAAAEGVQPPSITRIANALEERRLVERSVVTDDHRSYRLRLTPSGRRVMQAIRDQRTAWLATRVAQLGPRRVRDLERSIAMLEQIAEGPG